MRFTQVVAVIAATVATATISIVSGQKITFPSGATIIGTLDTGVSGHQVQVFRGIQFAEPPKRWKQAVLKPVSGIINATAFGSACHSDDLNPASEDCLFVNVYSPVNATHNSKLPVMMWIYGGGFETGMSNLYPGTNLVDASSNQIVYVSFNYRVGMFGFFSNAELLAEGAGVNFGLRDQEIAFKWVKRYIAQFGGNPNDITAFGESAGSMSVAMHMISRDGNQKLFKRGIMESGTYITGQDTASLARQANNTVTIATLVGCPTSGPNVLSCLRSVDAVKLNSVGTSIDWRPTIDGVFLRDSPIRLVEAGKISRIPAIIGTNTDEGWMFTPDVTTPDTFATFLRNRYPLITDSDYAEIEKLYPADDFESPRHRASEANADLIFVCPSELFAQSLAKVNPNHVFDYRFNQTAMIDGYPIVLHSADISYVLNDAERLPDGDEAKALVATIQMYWLNFGITGNPNAELPKTKVWPTLDPVRRQRLVLQSNLATETVGAYMPMHSERCAFWYKLDRRRADALMAQP